LVLGRGTAKKALDFNAGSRLCEGQTKERGLLAEKKEQVFGVGSEKKKMGLGGGETWEGGGQKKHLRKKKKREGSCVLSTYSEGKKKKDGGAKVRNTNL